MKIFFFIYIISICVRSSIIPIKFIFINGEMIFQIEKSKQKINCTISTLEPKNYIPENINEISKSKRQYNQNYYDDWFFIDENEFLLHYYSSPYITKCIISLSKTKNDYDSIIKSLYNYKKINNTAFGIDFDEKNESIGTLYLGGFPNEEKEGLNFFSYKYSFWVRFFGNYYWDLPILDATIRVNNDNFNIYLGKKAYINFKSEEFLIPPIFQEYLYENFYGIYIKEKSCNFEEERLFCDCKDIYDINGIESIFFNINEQVKFELNKNDFIEKKTNKCFFFFRNHNEDYFVFGKKFWKKYKLEFLNNNDINFYIKNKNFTFKRNSFQKKHNIFKNLNFIIGLSLFIFINLILLILGKIRKKDKND